MKSHLMTILKKWGYGIKIIAQNMFVAKFVTMMKEFFLDTIFAIDDPKNKKDFFAEMGRDKLNKFSRIRGIIETNEVAILEDLTEIASSNIKKTYRVSRMLIGRNFVEEFKFNKLSIKYSNLFNWLLPQSIKIDNNWDNDHTHSTREYRSRVK